MNQMLFFTVLQHVSAGLHVSVDTLSDAVTDPLCQSTLSCSVCQEDTDSQSVHMEGQLCLQYKCVYLPLVCKFSWQHWDSIKQLTWRNCLLQASDVCRLRDVMGGGFEELIFGRSI